MKQKLVEKLKQERKALDKKEKKKMDAQIAKHLKPFLKEGMLVASFASLEDEINTDFLFDEPIRLCFPKITGKGLMSFYEVNSKADFVKGPYNILEPKGNHKVQRDDIDVFIIPMLGFNHKKYRIGYGGGYYDRYLENAPGLKLGVAYSFQALEENFQKDYDVPCDVIITERGRL